MKRMIKTQSAYNVSQKQLLDEAYDLKHECKFAKGDQIVELFNKITDLKHQLENQGLYSWSTGFMYPLENAGALLWAEAYHEGDNELADEILSEFNEVVFRQHPELRYPQRNGGEPVHIKVKYVPYDRYTSRRARTIQVDGNNIIDALCKVCEKLDLCLSAKQICDENMTPEEIIQDFKSYNDGGAYDYICFIKDSETGEILFEGE